jgi:hypothetical protein
MIKHFSDILLEFQSQEVIGLTVTPTVADSLTLHDKVLLIKILTFISINNFKVRLTHKLNKNFQNLI